MGLLRIGQVYRYARPYSSREEFVDGLRNFFHVTSFPSPPMATLERGISPLGSGRSPVSRTPAILIRSSPHKAGSGDTPWEDEFDSDAGFVRYFGDNKSVEIAPEQAPGNRVILDQLVLHTSGTVESRRRATPFLLFQGVPHGGKTKGYLAFQGLGVLTKAELVTQVHAGAYFPNYVFEFAILRMDAEQEAFDWRWIVARRDASISNEKVAILAPAAWKAWIRRGLESIERVRRRVSRFQIVRTTSQRPEPGSREHGALREIYDFYTTHGKSRFESLASRVVQEILARQGAIYREGWVTPPSSDHGADFVGRLDLGHGFASTKVVVLGQAKCEKLDAPTGGVHIARTVARLRRGWIGAYVTTSYFSCQYKEKSLRTNTRLS